jgi:hypothetical protein
VAVVAVAVAAAVCSVVVAAVVVTVALAATCLSIEQCNIKINTLAYHARASANTKIKFYYVD